MLWAIVNGILFVLHLLFLRHLHTEFVNRGRELISAYRQLRDASSILQQCRNTLLERQDFASKVIVERIAHFYITHGIKRQ